jgi:hypothetical protein
VPSIIPEQETGREPVESLRSASAARIGPSKDRQDEQLDYSARRPSAALFLRLAFFLRFLAGALAPAADRLRSGDTPIFSCAPKCFL